MPEPEDAREEGKPYGISQTFCQDTSHEATLPGQAQKQAKVTCTSNRLQASIRDKEDRPGQGSIVLFSVSHLNTRPADHRRHGHAHGSLRRGEVTRWCSTSQEVGTTFQDVSGASWGSREARGCCRERWEIQGGQKVEAPPRRVNMRFEEVHTGSRRLQDVNVDAGDQRKFKEVEGG